LGVIVNIVLIYGMVGFEFVIYGDMGMMNLVFYVFDKGGMINFMWYLVVFYVFYGIWVNCISFGGLVIFD